MVPSITAPHDDKHRLRARAVTECRIPPPPGAPRFGWTPQAVTVEFTANLAAGDPVVLYNAHDGMHRYQFARVVDPRCPLNRIELDRRGLSGGTKFHRSGISLSAPRGKTWVLPAVPALMDHLRDGVDVILDVAPFDTNLA